MGSGAFPARPDLQNSAQTFSSHNRYAVCFPQGQGGGAGVFGPPPPERFFLSLPRGPLGCGEGAEKEEGAVAFRTGFGSPDLRFITGQSPRPEHGQGLRMVEGEVLKPFPVIEGFALWLALMLVDMNEDRGIPAPGRIYETGR